MSIFETNLDFLSRHYPALLKAIETPIKDDYAFSKEMTRNGEMNLRIEINQISYYLHSRYNAYHEAVKWAESIADRVENVDNVLLVGIGLGYFLEELLAVTKAKYIYVYEPSILVFKEWINSKLVEDTLSDPRIRLFAVGESEFIPLQIANDISEQMIGSFVKVVPPIYGKLFPSLLNQLDAKIKETIIQEISNMQTREFNQNTWLANGLFNLSSLIKNSSICELKDIWKDQNIKAIIVGSGPSLSRDIHYLSQLKDKCLIIAAGSSIQAMKHFGVDPHFVVSMDGTEANNRVFRNVDTSNVPLVFLPSIYYEIIEDYKGPIYYSKYHNDLISKYLFDTLEEIPSFLSTSTVTGTAIQIAAFMGITEIILMGQDLSYPNNEYYAPGVEHIAEEVKELQLAHSEQLVKNVDGGYNRTKGSMEVLRKDIETLVKIMEIRGVRILNTSKGGAVIEGTEWKSLDDIVPDLLEEPSQDFDITNKISKKDLKVKEKQLHEICLKLKRSQKEIDILKLKLMKLEKILDKLEDVVSIRNANRTSHLLVEVDSYWTAITKMDVFNHLYQFSLAHHMNIYMRFVPEIVETKDIFKKGKLITTHLGQLIKRMQAFTPNLSFTVEKALERLETLELKKCF